MYIALLPHRIFRATVAFACFALPRPPPAALSRPAQVQVRAAVSCSYLSKHSAVNNCSMEHGPGPGGCASTAQRKVAACALRAVLLALAAVLAATNAEQVRRVKRMGLSGTRSCLPLSSLLLQPGRGAQVHHCAVVAPL